MPHDPLQKHSARAHLLAGLSLFPEWLSALLLAFGTTCFLSILFTIPTENSNYFKANRRLVCRKYVVFFFYWGRGKFDF